MNVARPPKYAFAVLLGLLAELAATGCSPQGQEGNPNATPEVKKTVPVRVLVVDDNPLADALERQWRARTDSEIQIGQETSGDLLDAGRNRLGADIIIYPSQMLGELATRELISPLGTADLKEPSYAQRDIFPLLLQAECRWGNKTYAVPFGSPQLTLHYRPDDLDRLKLAVPTDWREYVEVARQLSGQSSTEGPFATAEPLADGWAGKVLLARAAAYARHPSQYSSLFDLRSMEPLIARQPFVRALEELVAAAKLGAPGMASFTPRDVYREFSEGRASMALTWPSPLEKSTSRPLATARISELPGSDEMFDFRADAWEQRGDSSESRVTLLGLAGRIGSVTRECRQAKAATRMLLFFSGVEIGREVSPQSDATTLFRESQLESAGDWGDRELDAGTSREYGKVVQIAQSRTTWMHSVRIPGAGRYMAALDQAVHRSLAGDMPPQTALEAVAETWREITMSIGLESQKSAYSKSLGLEP